MKKRCLATLLALAMCLALLPAAALAADSDFVIENGVLTKYTGPGGDIIIPEGVTSIGNGAFNDCDSLTSVVIPVGVTSVGSSAFASCSGLTTVTIPATVDSIGESAFAWTPWLESLGEFPVVNGILLAYQGEGGNVTIPDGVTVIADRALQSCYNLTGVVIPEGVTRIGDWAFYLCTDLVSVTIPDSVRSIGEYAFYECRQLTAVNIPDGLTSIESHTFESCGLTGVVIPDSVTSIGDYAFDHCDLTSVVLPDRVTSIGEYAFSFNEGLTRATIPDSVTRMGEHAFVFCRFLTVYGRGGSVAERYCRDYMISFVGQPGSAREGSLESAQGESVTWDIAAEGQVTVDVTGGVMDAQQVVLVACYDDDGRFVGAKWITVDKGNAQVDPATAGVKLFWLDAMQKPQSPSVTVWGK